MTSLVSPADQYQIGDKVIYLPEGVRTKIAGYVWVGRYGCDLPEISTYRLDCGIAVPRAAIVRDSDQ